MTSRRGRTHALRRVAGALLVSAMALVGTAVVGPPALDAAPSDDSFYRPPSPLPSGDHGDVIRSRRANFTMDPLFKLPVPFVKSWQVMYRSENASGEEIAVTGTVLVPSIPWFGRGERPLVTWGVGTRGLGDDCAPSQSLSNGTDYEALFIKAALDRGWAVAISDMEGLGTPGQHTYEVGRSQGRAVLDMARAAQRLDGTGLSGGTPVGVMGYSQGGTSAGWAAELASTYTPELDLKGVVASGVPADLAEVASFLEGRLAFAFALFAAVGYDAAYPELDLPSYLDADGRELLEDMQDVCLVSIDGIAGILGTAFKDIDDYTTENPLEDAAWQARLGENRLGSVAPTVPVFQAHARLDEIVPLGQAEQLREDWCARGANLTWRTYGGEHAIGLVISQADSLSFLADRFAGRSTGGNC
jgi:hypothetical protein